MTTLIVRGYNVGRAIDNTAKVAGLLAVLWGGMTYVGKPLAQDLIEQSVQTQIGELTSQIATIQTQITASDVLVAGARTQLESLQEQQREQREDTRTILRLLQDGR